MGGAVADALVVLDTRDNEDGEPVEETQVRKLGSIARTVEELHLHELAFAEAKKRVVTEFTDAYVHALLKATNNNVSEAARRSGLDRSNFRRLYRK